MTEHNSIVAEKEYGQIHCRLKELIEARKMTRGALARAVNSRFEVIDRWYNDEVEKIDADVLARICYVLKCSVDDIFEYNSAE